MMTKLKQNKDERGLSRSALGYQQEPQVTNAPTLCFIAS